MFNLKQIFFGSVLFLLAANCFCAETNGFECQTITLPAKAMPARFLALDASGRSALLAVDPAANQLLIYRQHASGFSNAPDQVIELPRQTAWIAPYRVKTNDSIGLLMSTASGVVYFRQSDGVFESEPRTLFSAQQIFTNGDPPILILLKTNSAIPVISATQAWRYQQNSTGDWNAGPPLVLEPARNIWSGRRNAWTLGQNSAYDLDIYQSRRVTPEQENNDNEKPENDTIGKMLAEMKKTGQQNQPHTERLDLNGDGQKDFVVWQVLGEKERKTDIYIFLRGADGKLPERPTQTLHCRGFPIPLNSTQAPTPFGDLEGNGKYELVLLEPAIVLASVGSLVDMALTRGMDVTLTIRLFNHDSFSRSPDASVPLKILLSWYGVGQWPYFICGDFNGDGQPDLAVQRSSTQWEILFSTKDSRWFDSHPGMTFEMPTQGYFERREFEISDLNGDGRSDIVLRDPEDPRIFIFLTQPTRTETNP